MALDFPVKMCSPLRAPDGQGGTVEIWDSANEQDLWIDGNIGEQRNEIQVNAEESIGIGDWIKVPYDVALRLGLT